MSMFRRRLLMQQEKETKYDNILGIMLKTTEIIPYSKVPSIGYSLDEVIGVFLNDSNNGVKLIIHPSAEKQCYFGSGNMSLPNDYQGIITADVSVAVTDMYGYKNTEKITSTGQGNNTWACNYAKSINDDGLSWYVNSLGEAQIIGNLLPQINYLLRKCGGVELGGKNYWTTTLNSVGKDTNTINSAWITDYNRYRDGANVQAIMSVRPVASYYIKFADPEVERICVENWSSDGIGLTKEDAKKSYKFEK